MTSTQSRIRGDVLLVGSMPYETAEVALRAAGTALRGRAGWLPDGEVNERKDWVGMLPLLVFPETPGLEETLAPPEHELEQPDRDDRPPVEDIPGFSSSSASSTRWMASPSELDHVLRVHAECAAAL